MSAALCASLPPLASACLRVQRTALSVNASSNNFTNVRRLIGRNALFIMSLTTFVSNYRRPAARRRCRASLIYSSCAREFASLESGTHVPLARNRRTTKRPTIYHRKSGRQNPRSHLRAIAACASRPVRASRLRRLLSRRRACLRRIGRRQLCLVLHACAARIVGLARLVELRSEERHVEKECRSRWSPYH